MSRVARFVGVLSVCSFILTFAFVPLVAASTVEVPLFGPEQFVRDTGSPVTETRQFSVQRLVTDSYVLRVENGSMEGDSLVSSAVITLNGTVVLKQNDFNQGVYSLDKPVGVQASNILEVKLGSIPTSYLSLTIVGKTIFPRMWMTTATAIRRTRATVTTLTLPSTLLHLRSAIT